MVDRAPAEHRTLRGCVFGLVTAGLCLGAHASVGGALPSPTLTVLLAGFVGCLATVLSRRYRRAPTLAVAAAGCQLLIHEALMAGSGPLGPGCATMATMHRRAACGASVPMPSASLQTAMSPMMMGAHLAAAVLAAVVMARGERALAWVRAWAARVRPVAVSLPADGDDQVWASASWLRSLLQAQGLAARGPPVGVRVVLA